MPLAALNSALACGFALGNVGGGHSHNDFLGLAFLGASFGIICWLPALVLTLLLFGIPIGWAQRLAAKGLAGEERGEWIVGLASASISAGALAILALRPGEIDWMPGYLGLAGAIAGATATALAFLRELRRRRFVTAAAAGKIAGYRVDATDEGKVLVRIGAQGKGYRVADFEEEVFELDADGAAVHDKRSVAA
jgi:hypothetical protein